MAITEETRHRLYLRLEAILGPEEAATLMEHLPPTGWADVATKRDLDHLAAATKRDIDHLIEVMDLRFERYEQVMDLRFERAEQSMDDRFERMDQSINDRFERQGQSMNDRFERQGQSMNDRFEGMEQKLDSLQDRFTDHRNVLVAMMASNWALVGLAFAAARLL